MKITYTGRQVNLLPKDRTKLEKKLAKVAKIIDRKKGEKEIHVIFSQERHLVQAEITMFVYDHAIVGVGSDGDEVKAMSLAIEKLEKQILKLRTKRRDSARQSTGKVGAALEPVPTPTPEAKPAKVKKSAKSAAPPAAAARPKVYRVNHQDGRKPMTLEEAMLEMKDGHDYLVYRDAKTDRVCTLLRRGDGHLDLVES